MKMLTPRGHFWGHILGPFLVLFGKYACGSTGLKFRPVDPWGELQTPFATPPWVYGSILEFRNYCGFFMLFLLLLYTGLDSKSSFCDNLPSLLGATNPESGAPEKSTFQEISGARGAIKT